METGLSSVIPRTFALHPQRHVCDHLGRRSHGRQVELHLRGVQGSCRQREGRYPQSYPKVRSYSYAYAFYLMLLCYELSNLAFLIVVFDGFYCILLPSLHLSYTANYLFLFLSPSINTQLVGFQVQECASLSLQLCPSLRPPTNTLH
jgi:hypothetical protein